MTTVYGPISDRLPGQIVYGLTTSNGMIGLIVAMVGGVLVSVLAMAAGMAVGGSIWVGVGGALFTLAALIAHSAMAIPREQARLPVLFPTPRTDTVVDAVPPGR